MPGERGFAEMIAVFLLSRANEERKFACGLFIVYFFINTTRDAKTSRVFYIFNKISLMSSKTLTVHNAETL